jgi:hypothetical protein
MPLRRALSAPARLKRRSRLRAHCCTCKILPPAITRACACAFACIESPTSLPRSPCRKLFVLDVHRSAHFRVPHATHGEGARRRPFPRALYVAARIVAGHNRRLAARLPGGTIAAARSERLRKINAVEHPGGRIESAGWVHGGTIPRRFRNSAVRSNVHNPRHCRRGCAWGCAFRAASSNRALARSPLGIAGYLVA